MPRHYTAAPPVRQRRLAVLALVTGSGEAAALLARAQLVEVRLRDLAEVQPRLRRELGDAVGEQVAGACRDGGGDG